MSRRLEKINKHIQRTFGEILQKEADVPADVLVTISRVDTTGNLKSAEVWLYVHPDSEAERVLTQLKEQMYDLQGAFNRLLDMRPLPRLLLRIDYGAENAEKVNRALEALHATENDTPTPPAPSGS